MDWLCIFYYLTLVSVAFTYELDTYDAGNLKHVAKIQRFAFRRNNGSHPNTTDWTLSDDGRGVWNGRGGASEWVSGVLSWGGVRVEGGCIEGVAFGACKELGWVLGGSPRYGWLVDAALMTDMVKWAAHTHRLMNHE